MSDEWRNAKRTGSATPALPARPATPPAGAPTEPAEPPKRRIGRSVALIAGTVALVLAIGAGIFWGASNLPADDPVAISTPPSPTSPQPAPSTSRDTAADAQRQLGEYTAAGTQLANEQLLDTWVVQLSAKQAGLQAEGKTWNQQDILDEYESIRQKHGQALILRSDDWSSFQLDGFWVVVLNEPHADADAALAWCRDQGYDRDHCFAKKLSKSEGPEGTTRLND